MGLTLEKRRSIRSILIIRMRYIGDTVLITPLVHALREGIPHASIDVVVNRSASAILLEQPYVNYIWSFNDKNFKRDFRYTLRFVAALRKQHYDLVIDLTDNDRSALFTFLSGAPLRIGYRSESILRRRLFYTHVVDSVLGNGHTVDHHLKVAEALALPVLDRSPFLYVSAERIDRIEAKLAAKGLKKEEAFAVIHPGARRWYKSWPPERFARLADAIIKTYGVRLVLLGSKDDEATCSTILDHMESEALNLAGQIQLSELPALIKKSLCIIGNDSAPIHVATSVETPAIALFGPTKWEAWGPRRRQDRVVAAEYPCRPCGHSRKDCPLADEYCMNSITFEAVWETVKEVFSFLGIEASCSPLS